MDENRVKEIAASFGGAVCDYPFSQDFETAVFRLGAGGKWFGILLSVPRRYFGEGEGTERCLDLKCDPVLSRLLRETYRGILPAYHMNKTHWITVRLHADVPDEEVEKLLLHSYALVLPRAKNVKKT